jgi:hypothetical protein
MRGYPKAAALAVAALLAGPAAAQSIGEINAAERACRDFVLQQPVPVERGVTAEQVRATDTLRQGPDLRVTFVVDAPTLGARGECLMVGIGTNWSVGRLTMRATR